MGTENKPELASSARATIAVTVEDECDDQQHLGSDKRKIFIMSS